MEAIKKAGKQLDREIGMLKFRFIGNLVLNIILGSALIYVVFTERIYVAHPKGGIWEAAPESRTDTETIYIEADDHIRKFYATFLTFNHLDFDKQIPKAYGLGGNVIKDFYKQLKADGFYNLIIQNNYRVSAEVKECKLVGVNGNTVLLRVTGQMVLENEFIREIRNMNMNVTLILVRRVPVENPHGMSIEGIDIPDGGTSTVSKENL